MEIYHYHPITGEYLGSGQADESPLEPGVWLIPAYAVTNSLPEAEAGKARVWNGSEWTQVPDHRGETWWLSHDGPVTIRDLGDPAEDGLYSTQPETPPIDPLTIPLNAVQFHAMIGILGKTAAVASAVEALDEPARSIARARINHSQQFRRNHELFTQLAALVGVTDAEIDAAWPQALAIE